MVPSNSVDITSYGATSSIGENIFLLIAMYTNWRRVNPYPQYNIDPLERKHMNVTLLSITVVTTMRDGIWIASNLSFSTHLVEIKECDAPESNRTNKGWLCI